MNSTGASYPGIPGILIGRVNSIAWASTAVLCDVSDVYEEKIVEDKYRVDGEWRDLKVRKETINVKGKDPIILNVKTTHRGPVMNETALSKASILFGSELPKMKT